MKLELAAAAHESVQKYISGHLTPSGGHTSESVS